MPNDTLHLRIPRYLSWAPSYRSHRPISRAPKSPGSPRCARTITRNSAYRGFALELGTLFVVTEAERHGFRNILCPSSYQVGQDTLSFVAGCAPITDRINLLAAIRCGEMQPIMLARTVATLDHMLEGRLTLNVISSDFPGEKADSGYRYQRSREVVEILKQAWTRDTIDYQGEVYQFKGLTTDPAKRTDRRPVVFRWLFAARRALRAAL